jgi:hypothetical protein
MLQRNMNVRQPPMIYFVFLPFLIALSAALTVIAADMLTAKLAAGPASNTAGANRPSIIRNPA